MRAAAIALAPFFALSLVGPADAQVPGPTLELARLQKGVKSRRVSSYDVSRRQQRPPREAWRRASAAICSTSRAPASSTTSG